MTKEMNEVMENLETVVENVELTDIEPVVSGKGIKGIVVGVGTTVVAAGVGLAIKNRAKLKAMNDKRMIKKLEKHGYNVSMADPDMEVINDYYDSENIDIPTMEE